MDGNERQSALREFHVSLHPLAAAAEPGPAWQIGPAAYQTLAVPPSSLAATFPVTFEEASERLERLPRMFVEPDGSFVWVPQDDASWQLDGVLYDRGERLLYVELKGRCPSKRLDDILAACGWPETRVMFQLLREAVFFGEAEFRRYACGV